jgi:3-phenylpropionate/cinnamic acid dioxygenase small subunit
MTAAVTSVASTVTWEVFHDITGLLHRAARLLDERDFAAWIELFTDDGTYKAMSAENHERGWPLGIIDDDRARMFDRLEMIEHYWNLEPTTTRHLVTNVDVSLADERTAVVASYFAVFITRPPGTVDVQATGRYSDDLVHDGSEWRFRHRLAIYDNTLLRHAVPYPL